MQNFKPFLFLSMLLCCAFANVRGSTLVVTRSFVQGYIAGETLDVRLDVSNPDDIELNALYLRETLPAGWTFDAIVSDNSGGEILRGQTTAPFECLWLEMPTNSAFRLTYRVNVPAGTTGAQRFSGELDWARFDAPQTVTVGGTTSILSDNQVVTPVITPADGTRFEESLTVTIDCGALDADLRYTLDGSAPTSASTLYTAPFDITQACTVNAQAFKTGKLPSVVATATYYQTLVRDSVPSVGVRVNRKLADIGNAMGGTPSLVKISKASLPPGLKIALVKDSAGNYSAMLTGVPTSVTKAPLNVIYEVRTKVKQGTKTVTITLTTIELNFEPVVALPAPVVATYNGWLSIPDTGIGTLSMTLSSKGAASGKLTLNGVSYTFKSTAFDDLTAGIFAVAVDIKAGAKYWDTLDLIIDASGAIIAGLRDHADADVRLYRNAWSDAGMPAYFLEQFAGYYTAQIPTGLLMPDETAPQGTGYMTLTLSTKGAAKWSGKLADGQSFSGSGSLLIDVAADAFFLPVVASYNSKKADFAAILEIKPGTPAAANTLVSFDGYWRNTDFKSVYSEDLDLREPQLLTGFASTVRVAGGYYTKTADLAAHYLGAALTLGNTPAGRELAYTYTDGSNTRSTEYTPSACDGPQIPLALTTSTSAGLTFNVKDDLKKIDGEYNYDDALNPLGLTFKFTKATGLFSGKFNLYYDYLAKETATAPTHTKKSVSYYGLLTPWRAPADATLPEGAGYYLLNLGEKCPYIDAKGKALTYPFAKWSCRFWINVE